MGFRLKQNDMIQTSTSYTIECDRCINSYYAPYCKDYKEALAQAKEAGWHEHNGTHFCPNCTQELTKMSIDLPMRLGDFLKFLIDSHCMTQDKAAKELGCSQSKLNCMIHSKVRITYGIAKKFQSRFGIPSFILKVWQDWEEEIFGAPK